MKITNDSLNAVQITDLLLNSSTSQWQDGVRTLVIPVGEYRTVPNIEGCNSVSVKQLVTDNVVSVDTEIEPDGTDMINPDWEVGGPIVGMPIS